MRTTCSDAARNGRCSSVLPPKKSPLVVKNRAFACASATQEPTRCETPICGTKAQRFEPRLGNDERRQRHSSLLHSTPAPAELIRHSSRIEVRALFNPGAGCKYELEGVLSRERYGDGRPEAKR